MGEGMMPSLSVTASPAAASCAWAARRSEPGRFPPPASRPRRRPRRKKDVNCIFIFTLGGMSQHDLWDYKARRARRDPRRLQADPDRACPASRLTDLLPHTAKVTDKLAILRSLTHGDSDHGRGYHIMMTGITPGPGDFNSTKNNNVHPSLGSMVARMGGNRRALPPYISVPCFLRSGGPAFLGAELRPVRHRGRPRRAGVHRARRGAARRGHRGRDRRRQAALREINRFERTGRGRQQGRACPRHVLPEGATA